MKFYIEILHPTEDKVLWHYSLEASDQQAACKAASEKVLEEHSNGFLLHIGGLFMLNIEVAEGR